MSTPIYLSLPDVAAHVSLSEATVQKMVREKNFPKPRLLSANRVGWLYREVIEWAEARPVSDLPPPKNTGAGKGKRGAAMAAIRSEA
jgi:prophage regulatory protein